jgi:hypothetical protein
LLAATGVTLALAAPEVALASPASCRLAIAQSMSRLVKVGYKNAASCQSKKDKAPGAASGPCRVVTPTPSPDFDPKGRYTSTKSKLGGLITPLCSSQPAVLANYDNDDPVTTVSGDIGDTIGGNTLLVLGNDNLGGDKNKARCVDTIAKEQGRILKRLLKNSIKCQTALDLDGGSTGGLDPTCVDIAATATGPAHTRIAVACGSLTASDVGTCSPLPDCVIDNTVLAGQNLARDFYRSITPPPPVCGNSVIEGNEQCDHGANNGTPGDLCDANCLSLAETCGPGTPAAGSIVGHRIVKVALAIPGGKQLAGVRVGFDYPQLEASIKGTGSSDVVHSAVTLLQPTPGTGFLDLAKDDDSQFSYLLAAGTEFIDSGDLFQVVLDECVPLSQNICSRSQNIISCCPTADIVACNANPDDPVACFCGAFGVVNQTDCKATHCTLGVCANFPDAPAGSCDTGTLTCTTASQLGRPCTTATEKSVCADWAAPAGSCSGTTCAAGSPNPGKACTTANEALACSGSPVDESTCEAEQDTCSRLGDQTNGTYGCGSIFNPVGAKNNAGQFPPVAVGPTHAVQFGFFPSFPPLTPDGTGACPTNNVCVSQTQQTQVSCVVTDPVDGLAQPVSGVTCTITITEAP